MIFYDNYLNSFGWRERAAEVKRRADGRCEMCDRPGDTDVHHLSYRDVGNEDLVDLAALCRRCHMGMHGHIKGWEPPCDDLIQKRIDRYHDACEGQESCLEPPGMYLTDGEEMFIALSELDW